MRMTPLDAATARPLSGGPSFSIGNRLIRIVWGAAWLVLARWTPPPLHRWRNLILKVFGAQIDPTARVHASAQIWLPAHLTLGADVLIGPGVRIYNQGRIAIGSGVIVSQGAHLCASSHDIRDPNFQLVLRPIEVAASAWIAADAFVGPGVRIGEGAVIGARAALFCDAEPWGVYQGNPAKMIKRRELRRPK